MRARHLLVSTAAVGAALLLGPAAAAGAHGSAATPPVAPAAPVVVVDAGAPEPIYDLTPVALPGTSTTVRYEEHILGSISGGGVTEPLDERSAATSTLTVVNAAPDGSFAATELFSEVTVVPDGLSAFHEVAPLVDVPLLLAITNDGAVTTTVDPAAPLTADQSAAAAEYTAGGINLLRFPADPVGVGAVWTVDQPAGIDDVEGTVTYTYRLAEVVGDSFRVDVTYILDFGTLVETTGLDVSGAGQGTASIHGSVTNPTVWRTEEHVGFDMTISDGTIEGHAVYGVWRTSNSSPA